MSISLSGSLLITGSLTASGTLTAQTLVVQTVTSSIVYSSGSNIFGNSLTNTQQMTGSLRVTGSGNHYILGSNVGIGTSTPVSLLNIHSGDFTIQKNAIGNSTEVGNINFRNDYMGAYTWAQIKGVNGANHDFSNITFSTTNGFNSLSEKVRITPEGYLRLAGAGIQFNGDTAAANSLNDYEEGSWTPALQNATVSYSTRSGTYVRIGNYVFVRWGFLISSISGTSGTVTISGLPFTSVSWGSYQEPNISVSTGVLATADNAFKARVFVAGANTNLVGRISNNADTPWDTSQLQNGSWIIGEIFYNV
jgi:hypothetical protein